LVLNRNKDQSLTEIIVPSDFLIGKKPPAPKPIEEVEEVKDTKKGAKVPPKKDDKKDTKNEIPEVEPQEPAIEPGTPEYYTYIV